MPVPVQVGRRRFAWPTSSNQLRHSLETYRVARDGEGLRESRYRKPPIGFVVSVLLRRPRR